MKTWSDPAWAQYIEWASQDRKTFNRINLLLKDTDRDRFDGIGKPELLKGDSSDKWSRRIDEKNRLVYKPVGEDYIIYSCKGHYGDH
ncbi:MAG: Txe/YoeB family addiction module toxin [Oscillospiraceae bacterium]|jgi:toxin YoeB|nr:Txe/YoeB family addiction module toxin [Oscillospiraceae bacterium]